MHPILLRHKKNGIFANAYIAVGADEDALAQFFDSCGMVAHYAGGIDMVRDIREIAYLARDSRIFFLIDADRLDRQSYPALLKLIEEPPERRHFILQTASAESVPETVRSRSVMLFFDAAGGRSESSGAILKEFRALDGSARAGWIEACAEDEARFGEFLDAYEQWARTAPDAAKLLERAQAVRASEKTLNMGRKMCLEYLIAFIPS